MKTSFINAILFPAFILLFQTAGYGQEPQTSAKRGFDALHYTFTLTLPDTGSYVQGTAEVRLERSAPESLLRLDLVGMHVSAVTVDGRKAPVRQDDAGLFVPIMPQRTNLDTVLVTVEYEGRPADGLIMKGTNGRWTAFGDNWPTRARYWLPTIDRPGDKATVTWRVNSPAGRKVIANGALVGSHPVTENNGRTLTEWTIHRPIPTYVMVIAAAPFVSKSLTATAPGLSEFPGGIPQTVHAAPEQADYVPGPFKEAVPIVEYFCRTIGLFPYEKLDHVQSFTAFGGMENASAIFYQDGEFRGRQINSDLIAHETAHQWFGDSVTPSDWPHLWLSEGFATYWAALWKEHSQGVQAFRSSMLEMRNVVLHSRITDRRPVIDTIDTNLMALLNSNSYQKGAWVLHMLRSTLGDSAFFSGTRLYYAQNRHKSVYSSDFQKAMEHSSGKDLGWFFEQWLRRPGCIHASLGWMFRQADSTIHVTVKQEGDPYRFPMRLMIVSGRDDTAMAKIEVPSNPKATISVPWKGLRPFEILFDPFTELLWSVTKLQD